MTTTPSPDLSIILPFHNEGDLIVPLMKRLAPVLDELKLTAEILCIDDGSTDDTYTHLLAAQQKDGRLRTIRFARNFGKEAALTCGLHKARGRAAITMDSDLQHPPETLPQLVAAWQGGARMVYAIRTNRDTDGRLRILLSKAFYSLFHKIAEIELPEGAGDFRLLDRAVIDAINTMPERTRFMKGLMTWVGFETASIPFHVDPRLGGQSNWNFARLFRFAFDGISSFSTLPLRIWTWFGSFISLMALAYGLFLALRTVIYGVDVPGYASLMTGLLFLGGMQLLSLGIVGEYLARVYTEVKGRPLYLIAHEDEPSTTQENTQ